MDKSGEESRRNQNNQYEPEPDYNMDEESPNNIEEEEEKQGICARIFCCCFGRKKVKNENEFKQPRTRALKIQTLSAMAGR